MRRREFIGGLGTATAWPWAVRAQQAKVPTIGFIAFGSAGQESQRLDAFSKRLREVGWIDGRNAKVEIRFSEGRKDRAETIADEFARLKVDIVITAGVIGVLAAKRAMPTTPIVFAATADPVAAGLVDSLARPGGSITGLSTQGPEYGGKQIELLREIVPKLRRLAVIANAAAPGALAEMRGFEAAAKTLGFEITPFEVREPEDIALAFGAMNGNVDALDVVPDPFTQANRQQFISMAREARIPAIYGSRENPAAGGLISFGPNYPDLYSRAAEFVDKILRGAKPADIPVEQPTKFLLVVNVKTAKAMGLTIPESFLARADEVIE
jgi:putative tryptophan/tyrosine transport system substrate-binding protein